ncbi:hypothetical protein [Paenibacillus gallinarum]|uniref:Uncharacterized protein n=1 Tax=Paenibacillus gallinarum TaxID=2762232 RepID=A0ABR8SXB5_9BACL|nr:hypothetical protein [Paenibacillus gallinarum]MBD7967739.1 hypothetical protein [Paenibacillus gallinarum]
MSKQEITKEFLEHIKHGIVEYWANLSDKTDLEKCDGVAFSILTLLDGYSGGMSPFEVKPLDEEGIAGEDIAGSLHEQYAALGGSGNE